MNVLSRRALNRATLARQLLLRRHALSAGDAIIQLVGLQAQTPHSWYLGLWTRLEGFTPDEVVTLLAERQVVRIALMRSTIHLVTADDCLALRPLVQPVIERSTNGAFGQRLAGLDRTELAAAGRALLEVQPLTFSELGRRLAERWPDHDPAALAQAVRAALPLIQVPPRGLWGRSGPIAHTTAEAWLGRPLDAAPSVEPMVLRYLGAFGSASVRDVQTWSGLTRLREVVERLRPQLVTFRDEHGVELFDLPEAPRPDPDTPAPPRFLYDFDNLLLSHADRSRVVTEAYRQQAFPPDGPMPSIVLVDGFTHGTWAIRREGQGATLVIQPFTPLTDAQAETLAEEGVRLLAFAAVTARQRDVQILPPNASVV
ncbi:MAG: winged helix DNA-binding domain-containing protein [Chloroflexales bacterium]|nr:winged helix DNA-binding domain-containing protein [Chloroflexales bacterium]